MLAVPARAARSVRLVPMVSRSASGAGLDFGKKCLQRMHRLRQTLLFQEQNAVLSVERLQAGWTKDAQVKTRTLQELSYGL